MAFYADYGTLTGLRHAQQGRTSEDYVDGHQTVERAWVAVADGCSGAHARTDCGARAWTHAFRHCHSQFTERPAAQIELCLLQEIARYSTGLSLADLSATLGVIMVSEQQARVLLWGDGSILMRTHAGGYRIITIEAIGNAPYYLCYKLDPDLETQWEAQYGPARVTVQDLTFDSERQLIAEIRQEQVLSGPLEWIFDQPGETLSVLAIATDGVSSRTSDTKIIPSTETARDILNIQSPNGLYLQRRLGRLYRDWVQTRTLPQDDLSVGAILWQA